MQPLDARFVGNRRERDTACLRAGSVGSSPAQAVHLVKLLGLRVIGLEIFILERPSRRRPFVMLDDSEILLRATEKALRHTSSSRPPTQ